MKISACLITLNEEENLGRCLRSCRDLADEIVVLDSGSTDGTERIAREFGALWETQPWLGYVGQKNKVLSLATHEWILSLDADEELSEQLRTEIQALKDGPHPAEVTGFSMSRCVLYDGRWIRHGDWYPDRLVRLFRQKAARFAGGRVHERLEISGRVLPLAGELYHYSFADTADHWARAEKYAKLWAESAHEAGTRPGFMAPVTHGLARWVRGYIFRGGFLDGGHGWRIARLNSKEAYLKYRLLRELNRASEGQAS